MYPYHSPSVNIGALAFPSLPGPGPRLAMSPPFCTTPMTLKFSPP